MNARRHVLLQVNRGCYFCHNEQYEFIKTVCECSCGNIYSHKSCLLNFVLRQRSNAVLALIRCQNCNEEFYLKHQFSESLNSAMRKTLFMMLRNKAKTLKVLLHLFFVSVLCGRKYAFVKKLSAVLAQLRANNVFPRFDLLVYMLVFLFSDAILRVEKYLKEMLDSSVIV